MKRLLLLAIVGIATAAPIHDEFRDKLIIFHQAYDTFLRRYLGCPQRKEPITTDGYEIVQCEPATSVMDQQAWHKAREAAKKLFDLEEKK